MKKLFIAALLMLTGLMCAQELENALLWKISGNGLKEPSYLYGTNHIVCNPVLSENTLDALKSSKKLFTETINNPEQDIEMLKQLPKLMMKNNVTLESLCTPEEYKLLDKETQATLNIPIDFLNKIAPFYVGLMLDYTKDCEVSGVETVLEQVASGKNIPVYGLEKADVLNGLFEILDKIDYKVQMAYLLERVKNGKTDTSGQLYSDQDINAMANDIYNNDSEFGKEIALVLLTARNNNWLPIIEKEIAGSSTFIAVGAAHLAGKDGLIPLLRNKGYTVEAVK